MGFVADVVGDVAGAVVDAAGAVVDAVAEAPILAAAATVLAPELLPAVAAEEGAALAAPSNAAPKGVAIIPRIRLASASMLVNILSQEIPSNHSAIF